MIFFCFDIFMLKIKEKLFPCIFLEVHHTLQYQTQSK
jgi:hypothetical protein